MPTTGTSANKMKDKKNKGVTNLIKISVFIIDRKIIIVKAKKVKLRCFMKKK